MDGKRNEQVRQVRAFNRAVTRRIGALSDDYLGRGRPLAESRLLFEIGREGADLRDLRARLSLDSGYLSRLLRALEAQGLVTSQPSPDDARVRRATLTAKGRREVEALDRRSEAFAAALLAPLGEAQRERLVAAMAEVERLMRAAAVTIEPADPAGADARACIDAYLRELAQRFESGFDPSRGPSADPRELVPPSGVLLLARLDGQPLGCGALKRIGKGVGEIKRMWVSPEARGLGIAQRLLDALEQHARILRLTTLRLDTNRSLTEARALYARNGYREIPAYNDNPYADHWFEKRLA
ncbi:bifunctional helix-turn-helix transcriptional regulator/GNAT family N-acetyltransferase [Vulcaniibacterium tengchongense]|uniref:MarR family transcriptional regulator with acetyltransferase activity n=1 Tax=Vulcaniibacterium tengchongense TaxID=1273429 RepID=A0A3N4VFZ9_9GAMM|nr:helix-turn-helix domain-containing GNAT family N-acetyltransferase [Vulcaniibacterium tengchongense]RPE81952.1 MarR family transcriptional regulator with acetyltransferase activity [Vulcaniibacterium tengchongense]